MDFILTLFQQMARGILGVDEASQSGSQCPMSQVWRKCSACKKDLPFGSRYYTCSVSTCNQRSTNYVFCSVMCFETHLPGARHKDAVALENAAPTAEPKKIVISGKTESKMAAPKEILIVASKLKDYVRARSDFNTSAEVMDQLSDIVRILCNDAIDHARSEGRKTVMARDFITRSKIG